MKKLITGILLAAFTLSAQNGDEAQVKAAHDAFVTAAKAGDGAALEKLLADGINFSHSNGNNENKQQAIAAMVKNKPNYVIESQTVHVFGKTATIRAKVTANTTNGVIPLSVLLVWTKNGNKWQIVERQTTRFPAS